MSKIIILVALQVLLADMAQYRELKSTLIWCHVYYWINIYNLQNVSGIRWYNLQDLLHEENCCVISWDHAFGVRLEGNAPKSGERTVGFFFATMLQHTGR